MTPAVRRLLREHDLTAAQIAGTGGGGRITREDVLKRRRVDPDRRRGPGPGRCRGHGRQRRPPPPASTARRLRPRRTAPRPRPPHPPARRSRSPKAPTKSSCR